MSIRQQISTAGGFSARWRGDSREIFYLSPSFTVHAAQMQLAGDHFEVAEVTPLFRADLRSLLLGSAYDVVPDGQLFLLNSPAKNTSGP